MWNRTLRFVVALAAIIAFAMAGFFAWRAWNNPNEEGFFPGDSLSQEKKTVEVPVLNQKTIVYRSADVDRIAELESQVRDLREKTLVPVATSGLELLKTLGRGRLTVVVVDHPEGADIKIMNIKAPYMDEIVLDQGAYLVQVTARGFRTERRYVCLEPGEDKFEEVCLGPKLAPTKRKRSKRKVDGQTYVAPSVYTVRTPVLTGQTSLIVPNQFVSSGDCGGDCGNGRNIVPQTDGSFRFVD